MQLLQRYQKIAEHHGSHAVTARGIARFMRSIPVSERFNPPQAPLHSIQREGKQLPQPWILDKLKAGDLIKLDNNLYYDYRFCAISDNDVAQRAGKAIGKRGKRFNYSIGNPQIYGEAYQPYWKTINYRYYKAGSHLYWNYQSCLAVSRSRRTCLLIQENKLIKRIIAPAGMLFGCDEFGVLLRRQSDKMDYHPTLEDYKAKNFAACARRRMAENFNKRAAARKEEKKAVRDKKEFERISIIQQRQMPDTRVTLYDSMRAGNCVEGSLKFAERTLGLQREEILACPWLITARAGKLLADGNSAAINATIQAWQRETLVSI